MKASELRVGNIVRHINEHGTWDFKVIRIGITSVEFWTKKIGTWQIDEKEIQGIPLTEEWLTKFGYDGDEDERHKVLGLGSGEELSVELLTNTCCLTRSKVNEMDDFVYIKYPEFVHQLQNLYFALTGEELIIQC